MEKENPQTKMMLALQKARSEFKPITKDTMNPYFGHKYATLDQVMGAVQDALKANGFILTESVEMVVPPVAPPIPVLRTEIYHIHSEGTLSSVLPLSAKGTDPQHQGAAVTYARRYNLQLLLSLLTEEDIDGNDPGGDPRRSSKPATKSKPQFKKRED